MKYLAYGSNLSIDQMCVRCPDATIIGKGVLRDWRLLFRQYATIEKCNGYHTPVLVWELSSQDEKNLDRYEGVPRFYIKEKLTLEVSSLDGRELGEMNGMVYVMTQQVMTQQAVNLRTAMPSGYYFALLADSYKKFEFEREILVSALRECDTILRKKEW